MPVSRGYYKLEAALPLLVSPPSGEKKNTPLDKEGVGEILSGQACADLGCSTGGFTECLIEHGAKKVYSIDTGYGVLDYKLRKDPRVIVMERTNALYVELPEKVDLVVIDGSWTRQDFILPAALKMLAPSGTILSLLKPQYEVDTLRRAGKLKPDFKSHHLTPETSREVYELVLAELKTKFNIVDSMESPVKGTKGNIEYWLKVEL